jgi:hypothetical protein
MATLEALERETRPLDQSWPCPEALVLLVGALEVE